jgi:hypothetical protein
MAEVFAMVLDGREVDVSLDAAITSTTYDLSIESTAAVTIVVQDAGRQLRRSKILDRDKNGKLDASIELELDGVLYRLAAVSKTGDTFTLTFEDRVVSRLRSSKGPLKPKGPGDHVAFARQLCRRASVPFVTPTGVGVTESGSALDEKRQRAEADDRREKGMPAAKTSTAKAAAPLTGGGPFGTGLLGPSTDAATSNDSAGTEVRAISADELTVQGAKATPEQIRNMEVVMGVATARGAGQKATLALVEACIVESWFRNLTGGDRDSEGILQVRVGLHGGSVARSVSRSCTLFLTTGFTGRGGAVDLAAAHADWSAGEIAQTVQGSDHPERYDKWRSEAVAIIDAYGGLDAIGGSDSAGRAGALVQRGTAEDPNEDSWAALIRIGEAKGWRAFALRGRVYYAREQDLVKSRPRAVLTEGDPGIDYIDWEVSPRKRVNTATVECRASLWAVPPGAAVLIKGEGVADGRWLVASFRRTRDSQKATVELRRGTELLKPEATAEGSGAGGVGGGGGSVYDAAKTVSDQNRAYLYGGGHGKLLRDIDGREPLDCSSSTCLALWMAGVFSGSRAQTSGELASSYGEPGRGTYFTVMANSSHVFVLFHGTHEGWRFDTSSRSGDSNQESGPRLRKGTRDTAGFTARRMKGGG